MTIYVFRNYLHVEIVHEAFEAEQIMFPQYLAMEPSHFLFSPHHFYIVVIEWYERFYDWLYWKTSITLRDVILLKLQLLEAAVTEKVGLLFSARVQNYQFNVSNKYLNSIEKM